jgi:putative restriction endonuclease
MLKHGIQELQDLKIILPSTRREWPDRDRLAVRYDQFRHAG